MEFLLRWRCQLCVRRKEAHCPMHGCNGSGYNERWVPYEFLNDVQVLKIPFIIKDCRKVREYASNAYLD